MPGYIGNPRPSLDEIRQRVYADINNKQPGQDSRIAYTPLNAVAEAVIGATYEMYGFLDWVARQTNVLDCEDENLDKYGEIWGISRIPAAYASGTATLTGINGSVLPSGSIMQTTNNLQFITTEEGVISSGTATVAIKSTSPGLINNLSPSTILNLNIATSGINSSVTIISVDGGADTEGDSYYRERIQTRISTPPNGGAIGDYIAWALQVPGVTRAFCYPEELGDGTVTVRFMMDNTYSNGIPTSGDVADVYNYINVLRPVTAKLTVVAPIPVPLDITVTGINPNTQAVKDAATAEIANMITNKAYPTGIIRISWIWEAVSLATGTNYHTITSPTSDVIYTTGTIAVPGTVTYD